MYNAETKAPMLHDDSWNLLNDRTIDKHLFSNLLLVELQSVEFEFHLEFHFELYFQFEFEFKRSRFFHTITDNEHFLFQRFRNDTFFEFKSIQHFTFSRFLEL
jgi:hypothetical protein